MQISSRLVVNQAALKLKRAALRPFLDAFERASRRADAAARERLQVPDAV
jgi:ATP phosphoribosyltransferase